MRDESETQKHSAQPDNINLESEETLNNFFDLSLHLLIIAGFDGRIRRINPGWTEKLGYSTQELVGARFINFVHPDDQEATLKEMEHLITGETTLYFENRYCHKNGSYRVMAWAAVSRPEAKLVYAIAHDITEQRELEKQLRNSEYRYRTLYEEAPVAYFSTGVDGIIEQANPTATVLLGYPLAELIGKPVLDLYADTPYGRGKAKQVFARFVAGEEVNGEELEMITSAGRYLWVSLSVRPMLDAKGRVTAGQATIMDITEHKRLDQLKDEFIGLVSHELRTPLTVVLAALQTILGETERISKQELNYLLQDAVVEAEHLSQLLTNLVELSRAQAGQLTLHREPIRIEVVAQNVIRRARDRYPNHDFVIDLDPGLPAVNVDAIRLASILYNLIVNAAKYSPPGSQVRMTAKVADDRLVVGVADNGPGIPPEDRERIFQPFQRAQCRSGDRIRGLGLGLLVCRRLVEAHGGRIWVESTLGGGSTFYFSLPLSTG